MSQIENISKAEAVKQQSRHLRGHIARDLPDTSVPFDKEGYSLLKFHGVYQGYDRDSATERKQRGDDKIWQFMVRVRIPGGRLTAEQYLGLDRIAENWADGSLRITTRQSIQFHGVVKSGLKAAIGAVDGALLTTLAACGDVVRTVTTVPAPIRDPVHDRLEADARRLSTHLLPQTGAYHEIWVDGEKWRDAAAAAEPADPLYGERYLPRKFKIGLAIPEDNTIDVLTNDLAIVPIWAGERLQGYDFLLGGGHGMTHNMPKTYPRLATPVAFVEPDDLLDAAAAVVRLHRDHGDRGNRRHARLKYVIAENGEDWARERLSRISRQGARAVPEAAAIVGARPSRLAPAGRRPALSRHPGGERAHRRRRAARPNPHRAARDRDPFRLQPDPDAEPGHHPQRDRAAGPRPDRGDAARAPGAPRRGHAAGPALGAGLPGPADLRPGPDRGRAGQRRHRRHDRRRLARYGLERERLSIRITGCPNGCARPYTGDIGIVGRMPGYYALFVGGDFEGTRLNTLIADKVAFAEIGAALDPLFARFAADRRPGEGFGDFCHRLGVPALQQGLAHDDRSRSNAAD